MASSATPHLASSARHTGALTCYEDGEETRMSLLRKLLGGKPEVLPTHLSTYDDFTRHVLQSDLPVIVDVWSPTCAPCRQLEPVLVKLATKYEGRVRVAELSTQADPKLLARLDVRATPTLLVFDGGQEVGRAAGFRPLAWFDAMIEAELPRDERG